MAMDTRMILAGRGPDVMGSYGRGLEVGQFGNQVRQENALRSLYAAQGPQIMQGQPNALNALARISTPLAMDAQGAILNQQQTRQDMAFSAEEMQMRRAQAKAEAEAMIAQNQAALNAAKAEEYQRDMMGILAGGAAAYDAGPEAFNAWAQETGLPLRYEGFRPWAARTAGEIDALDEYMKVAPKSAEPLSPEGKLQADINSGLLPPGTGQTAPDQNARSIDRLVQTGVPLDVATGIVEGRYRVVTDPVTGASQIIDMANPPVAASPAPTPPQAQAAPAAEPFGQQYPDAPNAFGLSGFVRSAVNTGADVLGMGAPFPEAQSAQADFAVLKEGLINDIASSYNRQPPSWLLKNIEGLVPQAGSVFTGPDQALAQLRAIGRDLQTERQTVETQLSRPLRPALKQELELRLIGLDRAIARVSTAMGAIQPPTEKRKTASGVTWEIVQ